MPPSSAGFCFHLNTSGSAEVCFPFVRGDVMVLLSLSCLPWALHLSGELFYLSYQALVGEVKRLYLIRVGLHCF